MVRPGRTNSVLMRNNFPELCATLIAALASLEMDELKKSANVYGHVASANRLIEIDAYTPELQIRITMVRPRRTNSVHTRNNFPGLCAALVAALASLDSELKKSANVYGHVAAASRINEIEKKG